MLSAGTDSAPLLVPSLISCGARAIVGPDSAGRLPRSTEHPGLSHRWTWLPMDTEMAVWRVSVCSYGSVGAESGARAGTPRRAVRRRSARSRRCGAFSEDFGDEATRGGMGGGRVTSSLGLTSPPEDTVSAYRIPGFSESKHASREPGSEDALGRTQLGAPLPHERCSTSLSAPMDGRCPLECDRLPGRCVGLEKLALSIEPNSHLRGGHGLRG